MIVLDTNVVSELMRPKPNARVLSWVDDQPARELTITAVTAAELRYGVERMARGRRRANVAAAVEAVLTQDFAGRVLPFAIDATHDFAVVVSGREAAGKPISTSDAQIAAICRSIPVPLATRNTEDFADTGVELINPWEA